MYRRPGEEPGHGSYCTLALDLDLDLLLLTVVWVLVHGNIVGEQCSFDRQSTSQGDIL